MFKLLDGSPYPKYSAKSDIYQFVCQTCRSAQLSRSRNAEVTSMITLVAESYNITEQLPDSKKRAKKEEIEKAKANIRALDDPSQIPTFLKREIFKVISEHESSNVLQYAILTAIEEKLEPLRQAQQEKRDIRFQELFGTREDFFNLLERELGQFMRDVILLKCTSNGLNLKASMTVNDCLLCRQFKDRLKYDPNILVVQLERVKVWNDTQRFDIHVQDTKDKPKSLHIFKAVAEKFNLLDNFEDERESIEKARIVALKPVFPMQAIGTLRKFTKEMILKFYIFTFTSPWYLNCLRLKMQSVKIKNSLCLHLLVDQRRW